MIQSVSHKHIKCQNGAPYIAWKSSSGGTWQITQGNCHDWTCPRCGELRASQEYAKMVRGIEYLAADGHTLFFLTLTCKGHEQSLEDAEKAYLEATNRLLTSMRTRARRTGQDWTYVQVTERQQRGHPHSHFVTTWRTPEDYGIYTLNRDQLNIEMKSDWLAKRIVDAGLGHVHQMTVVRSAAGAARYVAKYLFKSAIFENWPKGWRRIRYSRNWPKLENESCLESLRLMTNQDWKKFDEKVAFANVVGDADLLYVARKLPNVMLRER